MSDELPDQALFTEQVGKDIAAMVAVLLGSTVAAAGGLGGGGVFVPIFIILLTYPPKFAAALSQATIFGVSIVNMAIILRDKHSKRPHRPQADFSILLIFEPMLLVGTIIGVLLNVMFPDILILILLTIVIGYATFRTTRKGVRIWKTESADKKAAKEKAETDPEMPPTSGMVVVKSSSNVAGTGSTDTVDEGAKEAGRADTGISTNGASDGVTNGATNGVTNGATSDSTKPVDSLNGAAGHNESYGALSTSSVSPPASKHEHIPTVSGQIDLDQLEDDLGSPQSVVSVGSTDALNGDGTATKVSSDANIAIRRRLSEGCGVTFEEMTDSKLEFAEQIIKKESEFWKPMGIICIVWVAVVTFAILKKEEITSVTVCSTWYWLFTFLPIPIMAGVSYYMTKVEYEFYKLKVEKQCWKPADGDINLDGSFIRILKYPAIASIAGVLAGLLGIGGGMVVGPLFIELDVLPEVAGATSAVCVMITSSAAMLQFILLDYLKADYSLAFMTVGLLGGFVGRVGVKKAIKKWGRTSIVVFAVAIIMGLAILLMGINGITELVDGVSWAFTSPCDD